MDHTAAVDQTGASPASARAEQAIFTSIRSPMGRGYRIVAASAGILRDEKREIVQCAPSHGSLCDPSPTAAGLASFKLRSGRHCILLSRSAGIEHTARGGYRIHTHVLVMDPLAFRRLHCDPLSVEAAALPAITEDLLGSPPTRLDPLLLAGQPKQPAGKEADAVVPPLTADVDCMMHILSAVLDGRSIMVVAAPVPRQTLRRILGAAPMAVRRELSLSYGLKFSPSRPFQLVFTNAERSETERIVRDHDMDIFHWQSPPSPAKSSFDTWLRFVRQRWESGRYDYVARLASRLTQESGAHALAQIAALCADIERLGTADATALEQLSQRHARTAPVSKAHARLLDEFQKAARRRAEALAQQESAADDDLAVTGLA